jgi:hypothetical protein
MNPKNKEILLSSIAEAKGLQYSSELGLVEDEISITDNNQIAKRLLGQMTSDKDLATVESIVNVIIKLPNYEKLIETARKELDLPRQNTIESFQIGTVAWFRRMMEAIS